MSVLRIGFIFFIISLNEIVDVTADTDLWSVKLDGDHTNIDGNRGDVSDPLFSKPTHNRKANTGVITEEGERRNYGSFGMIPDAFIDDIYPEPDTYKFRPLSLSNSIYSSPQYDSALMKLQPNFLSYGMRSEPMPIPRRTFGFIERIADVALGAFDSVFGGWKKGGRKKPVPGISYAFYPQPYPFPHATYSQPMPFSVQYTAPRASGLTAVENVQEDGRRTFGFIKKITNTIGAILSGFGRIRSRDRKVPVTHVQPVPVPTSPYFFPPYPNPVPYMYPGHYTKPAH